MYRFIEDFLNDWSYESESTVKIFKTVQEAHKSDKLNENVRSLERLAWHLTQTVPEMMHRAGLLDKDPLEHQSVPAHFQDIIKVYQQQSQAVTDALKQKWTDADLQQEVNMYGQPWKKGQVLAILIRHQTHHRGQMTTLMRLLGMPVPGIYGPSKEEWSQMGLPAME